MKRISANITDDDLKTLSWIQNSTGCTITEAVRVALDMVASNFTGEMVNKHYLMLKNQDRESK